MQPHDPAVPLPESEPPAWRGRVLERSVARSEQAIRQRGIGPAARILEAAIALASETDGASFSVQQVLDRANTALRTFYRHFGSKDALLLAVLEETVSRGVQELTEGASRYDDPIEALHYVITDAFHQFARGGTASYPAIVRDHYRLQELFPAEVERTGALFTDLVGGLISQAKDMGLIGDVDVASRADLIMSVVLSQFHRARLGSVDLGPEEVAQRCWEFCYAALEPVRVTD